MLNKTLNQEDIIMIFFVVMLIGTSIYMTIDHSLINITYFIILGYYFTRFLVIKNRR